MWVVSRIGVCTRLNSKWWFIVGLVLAACDGSTSFKSTLGTLDLSIIGTDGVSAKVKVTGPNSYNREFTASAKASDIEPGPYTITPQALQNGGSTYTAAVQNVQLKAGEVRKVVVEYTATAGALVVGVTGLSGTINPPATLTLSRGGTPLITREVSANGPVRFDGLVPGQYSLEASTVQQNGQRFSAGAAQTLNVSSSAETSATLSYAAISGLARITVAGLSGAASPEGAITLTKSGATPLTQPVSTNGPVVFENLPFGSYALSASTLQIGSQTWVPKPADLTSSLTSSAAPVARTLNYLRPSLAVTLTGLTGTANITLTLTGASSLSQNFSSTSGISVVLPALGTYSLSATATQGNTQYTSNTVNFSATAANPTPTASLTMSVVPTSEKIIAVGNGNLSNSGWTASGQSTPGLQRDNDAVFNVNPAGSVSLFSNQKGAVKLLPDSVGNLYVMYQFISGSSSNRIVRINAANVQAGTFTIASIISQTPTVPSSTNITPTDMAFDPSGNLWVANEAGAMGCIQVSRLTGDVNSYDQQLLAPTGQEDVYSGLDGLAFDNAGNLWFTSGSYILPSSYGPGNFSRLNRILAAGLTCSGGTSQVLPDVRLNVSGPTGNPIYNPRGITLSPDGTSLWIADGGSGIDLYAPTVAETPNPPTIPAGCNISGSPNVSPSRESVFRVALSGSNVTPNTAGETLKVATIADRISVAAANNLDSPTANPSPSKGMQQPYALGFDSTGRLWVATNNNVEIDDANVCFPSTWIDFQADRALAPNRPERNLTDYLLTDRRGKLYVFTAVQLASGASGSTIRNLAPNLTLSAPMGNGLTGIAVVEIPNP